MRFPFERPAPIERFSALLVALVTTAALMGCATSPDLSLELANSDRPVADKARDAARRPGEVMEFLGVEPGMVVVDLIASGGYYSEVLSNIVGENGRVYAQNIAFVLELRDGVNEKALSARLADERLPNVVRLDRELDDLGLEPGSIDVVITALNFHDIYNARGPEAAQSVLAVIFEILKPGGVLGLIDHAGNPGANNEKLHRMEEIQAIEAIEAAGFVVEATSGVLRNPLDDRTQNVFAPELARNTDRFLLKVRKPS